MNVLKPHVSLNVTNLDASVAFYEKVFDVRRDQAPTRATRSSTSPPSLNLSMVEAPRSGVNASHFGIQVATTEDVAVAVARFKRGRAADPSREEDTSCCYAVQDKVWVEDPDGNMWEVFVVKGDSPSMRADQTDGCCAPTSDHVARTTSSRSLGRQTRMLLRKLVAEALGTALLLAAVVGSGIMGEDARGPERRARAARQHHRDGRRRWSRSSSRSDRSRARTSTRS